MDEEALDRLHVLIADENEQRLGPIATVVSDLGHAVVSRLTEVSQVAAATQRDRSHVGVVDLGHEQAHALDLISAIVREARCRAVARRNQTRPACAMAGPQVASGHRLRW